MFRLETDSVGRDQYRHIGSQVLAIVVVVGM